MTSDKKNALVTGAARGIGLAASKRLLAEGWSVAMLDRDGVEQMEESGLVSPANHVGKREILVPEQG